MQLHPIFTDKKLVLFDFDGTLVDSMPMWVSLDRQLLENNGIPVPEDLSERLIPLNEEQTAAVFLELGCSGTIESIRAEHDRLAQQAYEQTIPLKEGAKEILDALRSQGFKLGILSASTLERMLPCIARLGLTGYFNIILPCGEYAMNKDTPEPYMLALNTLGVQANEAVFADDFHGNISGAAQAGLTTIGVYDPVGVPTWALLQQKADLSVRSLSELFSEN